MLLHEFYNKHYAAPPGSSKGVDTVHTKSSPTSDFTARYEAISPDSINELEEYLKIKRKDFKTCDPLRWWRSQREDWPNLYRLACDILCIPGLHPFILTLSFCLHVFRLCCRCRTDLFQWPGHHIDPPCQSSTRDNPHAYGPEASPSPGARARG